MHRLVGQIAEPFAHVTYEDSDGHAASLRVTIAARKSLRARPVAPSEGAVRAWVR